MSVRPILSTGRDAVTGGSGALGAGRILGKLARGLAALLIASTVGLVLVLPAAPASAGSVYELTPHEARLFTLVNQSRAANGLVQLQVAAGATDVARNWSSTMANSGSFRHNPNYVAELQTYGQSNATRFAENVAYGYPTADAMFTAYMNSSGHRANIMNADMRFIGIGSVRNGSGSIYNTMNFVNAEDGRRPNALNPGDYFGAGAVASTVALSTAASGSATSSSFVAQWAGGIPLACDWNGDGVDTVGYFNRGQWSIPETNSSGSRFTRFGYGNPDDQPVCGDWNKDGVDTIGIYRSGGAYLRDANSTGAPSVSFGYGSPGDIAVAGDFNGDGYDSIGVKRGIAFYLSNSHYLPIPEITSFIGNNSDLAMMGDFNRDGVDTIVLHRSGLFIFTDDNRSVSVTAPYGNPSDLPLAGDFNGDGRDDKGICRG